MNTEQTNSLFSLIKTSKHIHDEIYTNVYDKIRTKIYGNIKWWICYWYWPAHNFMGEEDATHFGVFVLTFVNDRLKEIKRRKKIIHMLTYCSRWKYENKQTNNQKNKTKGFNVLSKQCIKVIPGQPSITWQSEQSSLSSIASIIAINAPWKFSSIGGRLLKENDSFPIKTAAEPDSVARAQ